MRTTPTSITTAVVVVAALIGITFLGYTDDVSSEAVVGIYTTVIGAVLGYTAGTRANGNGEA